MNATLPSGAGNSHTLAPRSLKLVQLSAVVASVLKLFHTVKSLEHILALKKEDHFLKSFQCPFQVASIDSSGVVFQ